jgi:hypothetical protein
VNIGRRLPQVLVVVPFILLLLATPHEHRTAESQFNWNPTPRIENTQKAGDDEALNELPAVYGPAAPNLSILPLAQWVGIRGQELHAPWAFVRLPSLRAPPDARSRSSVI